MNVQGDGWISRWLGAANRVRAHRDLFFISREFRPGRWIWPKNPTGSLQTSELLGKFWDFGFRASKWIGCRWGLHRIESREADQTPAGLAAIASSLELERQEFQVLRGIADGSIPRPLAAAHVNDAGELVLRFKDGLVVNVGQVKVSHG